MRPADLPDFGKPPLNEVVLGVQFSNPIGYSQIQAGHVWDLFRSEYPNVEEYMPLSPVFEIFGSQVPFLGNQLSFVDGPLHDRYWFLNESRDELIQFQQDRLLHNWRKVGDQSNDYPRFERMIERFTSEMAKLEAYLATLTPQVLQINQCEISYINHIVVENTTTLSLSRWLNFVNFDAKHPESLNLTFRETIFEGERPAARLICELGEVLRPDGQRAIVFNLTVRGAPKLPTMNSALEFLAQGRANIVRRFTELTTPEAHRAWERK